MIQLIRLPVSIALAVVGAVLNMGMHLVIAVVGLAGLAAIVVGISWYFDKL